MSRQKIIISVLSLLIILLGFWSYYKIEMFFKIDSCLDKGGRWNYEKQECEFGDSLIGYSQFDGSTLKGKVENQSKDTLKITRNDDTVGTINLINKSEYEFSRDEILKTINYYKENYGKETTSFDFVDNELDPKLYALAKMVCDNNDEDLLKAFLEMVLASTGSASETPSDIFAEIYFCNPDLMINSLTNTYTDEYLRSQLEFGFENATFGIENEITNYNKLKAGIDRLNK